MPFLSKHFIYCSLGLGILSSLSLAAPPQQKQLLESIAGPECGRATMFILQQSKTGLFGTDREVFQVLGTLQNRKWSRLHWTRVEDDNPEAPLKKGLFPFLLPRVGDFETQSSWDIQSKSEGAPQKNQDDWVWKGEDYVLTMKNAPTPKGQRVSLKLPTRISSRDGTWKENLYWQLWLDEHNLPREEKTHIREGDANGSTDLYVQIRYQWFPCL